MTTSITDPDPGDLLADDAPPPGTPGSSRPPRWLPRALAMGVVAVFVGIFAWRALGALQGLFVIVLVALFVALALEPATVWLVRKGWKRALAAATTLLGSLVVVLVMLALFGNLFAEQLMALAQTVPERYEELRRLPFLERFGVTLPESRELLARALQQFGSDVASSVLFIGTTVVGGLFSAITILLVAYYVMAAGPRVRAAVCGWLPPERQREVLTLWEITQSKVSSYLSSRVVLALVSAVCTYLFLVVLHTPYAIPLSVFVGVVSQFVPTIGAYIGGALPVMVALTAQGPAPALAVLAFVIGYQQFENLYFAPKVSAKALEMNAAVSLLVVLAFGAVFGAIGAFLALPIAATIQATATTYLRRHELIESHMLRDPEDGDWISV
ncbi:AI-2E family transporter [Antribacter gilvus]|uniref:AI-2E family transporter n=1 Tax=Antribacter gilvus TaxID=2304675 RepID=UPI001F0BA68D|nr:AI-2E family transporter [Antribacter gilvus]